jgi:glycosyltransferase involved in cell wall biosynthesis
VDYDDATFHWYDAHRNGLMRRFLGQKIDRVMRDAALVIVGNDYLAARARQAGAKRVEFLPSVVDLKRYGSGVRQEEDSEGFTVGWIGSPVTVHYLKLVESALIQVCKNGSTRIIVVGAKRAPLDGLNLETRPWSEDTEVEDIQSFDVGIMPLADTPWEQGKCGYKLIQYMACWKPIVASPVGINQKIVENGINGFLAVTTDEWICALEKLRNNYQCRRDMGKRGRSKVEMEYSLQIMAPRLESLLRSVIEKYP